MNCFYKYYKKITLSLCFIYLSLLGNMVYIQSFSNKINILDNMCSDSKSLIESDIHIFNNYIDKYRKTYDLYSSEYWYRYNIYLLNKNYINNFNSLNKSYKLGINKFADMSKLEFKEKYLGFNMKQKWISNYNVSNIKIPNSLDWRSMGAVTNIKNQKQCGSCWAFSAVGTIEGQHAIKIGNLVSLSEQNLVDCDNSSFGCEGGWPDKAIEYVINNSGIDTELSYPYVAEQQECSYSNNTIGATVSNVVRLPQADMNALYDALGTIGPISVAIDAEDDFQMYSSGIYSSSTCSTDSLDHAVLAVGYGISFNKKKYIIVKNSWGSDWGMNGYIYMSADIPNMCGIAENACYSNVTV